MIFLEDSLIAEKEKFTPTIEDQILKTSCKTLHIPIVSYEWENGDWVRTANSGQINLTGLEVNTLFNTPLVLKEKVIQSFLIWNFLEVPKSKRSFKLERKKNKFSWNVDFNESGSEIGPTDLDFTFKRYFSTQQILDSFETFRALITDSFFKENAARGILEYTKETGKSKSLNNVLDKYFNQIIIESKLSKFERFLGV